MFRAHRASLIDFVAAGVFAGAAVVSAAQLVGPAVSAMAGIAAFGAAFVALSRMDGPAVFELPTFAVGPLEPAAAQNLPELLLTEMSELLLIDAVAASTDELLLENRLPAAGGDSRVIRLFDPSQYSGAGDVYDRIERHLQPSRAAYPDASAELYSALAALKNSLR